MYYKKEKRKEIDLCNICGKSKRLTWDHVPPKCCNNRYAIKTNSWMEGIPEESSYAKKYQNGIKFRSLCDECNNKVLGANYDKVLEEFANQLAIIMQTSIALPPVVKVPIKINRLCRAICGHMLAAKNFYENECLIDKELREYVLDETKLPPKKMSLLYWIYPYSTIAIMRDICVYPSHNKYKFPKGLISIMNSFPAAYIIADDEERCGLFDLFSVCSNDIDETVEIPVDCSSCYFPGTKHLRPLAWPCNISDEEDGASFMLGVDKCMNDSKIAKHSNDTIEKIRNRRK